MRLPEDNDSQSASVNILPMIDVIFAILAFFIMSTLYLTKAEGLPVNLPGAVTATPQDQVEVTLTITSDGNLFLGDRAIALDELADRVRRLGLSEGESLSPQSSASTPISVTIRADKTTPHGKVISVMDRLRTLENVKLSIAATKL